MRTLFAVPWVNPSGRILLISVVSSLLLAFGAFALLKINSGGKRVPQELVTGSIQRSQAVRRSASNDPMAALSTQDTRQMAASVPSHIPLPRPRPKRL